MSTRKNLAIASVFVLLCIGLTAQPTQEYLSGALGNQESHIDNYKRTPKCIDGQVVLYSTESRILCMSYYSFALTALLSSVATGSISAAAILWAQSAGYRRGYNDRDSVANPARQAQRPDWERLGITPVEEADGCVTYTYDRSDGEYDVQSGGDDLPYSKYFARLDPEGYLRHVNAVVPATMDSKRDYHELNYSYGAAEGHRKTNLSLNDLQVMFTQGIQKAIDNNPGATGFCGSATNGGDWEAYVALTIDGAWGDCWMYIQNNT